MSHQYRLNPITGKLDMTGLSDSEIAELRDEDTAEWTPNVKELEYLGKPTLGKTAMQILHDLLVKDMPPTVTLSTTTAAGMYEEGDTLAPKFTAKPTQGTFSIASMTLEITNTKTKKVIYSETVNTPTPDEDYTFEFDGEITTNSNVQVSIIDSEGLKSESQTFSYKFGNYMYIGFADDITLEEDESIGSVITKEWLSSNLQSKTLKTSYTTNAAIYEMPTDNTTGKKKSGYLYIAMPTAWNCHIDNIYQSGINASGFVSCLGDIEGYQNEHNAVVSYRIFISNQKQVGDVDFYIK